jgi:hypothetical protein
VAAARALRRKDHAQVTADEESFTTVWRNAIRSMTSSQVTATSSLAAIAAAVADSGRTFAGFVVSRTAAERSYSRGPDPLRERTRGGDTW